jgi:hypothetical protein
VRTDERGNACPATLGEYRDISAALFGEESPAVAYLDQKIAEQGCDEQVLAPDSQMRFLLFSLAGLTDCREFWR